MKSRKRSVDPSRNNTAGRRIRHILFSTPNLRMGLSKVRQELKLSEIQQFVTEYARFPAVRAALVKNPFPSSNARSERELVLKGASFDYEISWHSSCMRLFADKLGEFHATELEVQRAFVTSNLDLAENLLDRIEREFGQSLWLISQRIFLYSEIGDVARLADYVESVAIGSEKGVPGLVAWFYAQKVDPEISISKFYQYADNYVAAVDDDTSYTIYLRWIVDREYNFDIGNLLGILTYSESSSLIDRYLALRDVIGRAVALGARVDRIAARAVEMLSHATSDRELSLTAGYLLNRPLDEVDMAGTELDIFDLYSLGRYKEAYDLCRISIEENPLRTHLYEIFARCAGRAGVQIVVEGDPLWAKIAADLSIVFLRADGFDQALQRIRRACHKAPFSRLIWSLGSFLARELTPDDSSSALLLDAQAAASIPTGSPWHWSALDQVAFAAKALDMAYARYPESPTILLQQALTVGTEESLAKAAGFGVPSDRIALYRGHVARRQGDYAKATEAYEPVLNTPFIPDHLAAAKGIALCLRAQEEFSAAVQLASDSCLVTPSAYRLFALPDLLDEIEERGLPKTYKSISLPIVYNLYSQHHSADRDSKKSDAAEEYVFSQGFRLPSELQPPEIEGEKAKYIYFLKEVCTPRTLDPFMDLETTSAVELERISICQRLTEADPDAIEAYGDEIREITRRRVIRERLKQVEKSKIFVDVPNIRRAAEKSLKDKFVRFQESISRPDYNHAFMGMVNTIREIVGKDMNILHFPDNPPDDREQTFRKLCVELMNLLLTSQEHGFKTYLSTRIKHGTLAAQLSSPFSLNHILLEANDGIYTRNEYWEEQLSLNDSQSAALHQAIEKFSREVEKTIEELKDQKIQIKSEDFPDAWLDFSVFRNETLFLQAQIDPDTTFDQFFDLVLTRFWGALDQNLANVRARLADETKPRVTQQLDQLQQAVGKALPGFWVAPLHSAIAAARTEFQNSMNVVIEWFKLTQAAERPDYEFSIAVDVAAESINNCFKSRPITVTRDIEVHRELKGETLESMVDILFILFENAITHANPTGSSSVSLRAQGGENVLLLEVENGVPPQADILAKNTALSERLGKVASASSQAMVAKEGGSGFPKIVKILKHDLSGTSVIRARYTGNSTFRTDIEFESSRVFV